MDRICVLDTETTGRDPSSAGVVEYAHLVVSSDGEASGWLSRLTRPEEEYLPIPPDARAVHHISDDDIADCPHVFEVVNSLVWSEIDYLCAHNAPYDVEVLGDACPKIPVIDTWRCSLHVWPEAPSHSNQTLRYWLDASPCWPGGEEHPPEGPDWFPHRALYDACVTAGLLRLMLRDHTPSELCELSKLPALLHQCNFGKHRGKLWSEVPRDYLRWVVRTGGFDEDVMFTARHYARIDL